MPTINLALQGGGAHGAFTWGALERLLDEPDIEIEAITATSAGAMNGAALKAGLAKGSRAAALENLAEFWEGLTSLGGLVPAQVTEFLSMLPLPFAAQNALAEANPAFLAGDALTRTVSPYQLPAAGAHPLRPLVEAFGIGPAQNAAGPLFFVGATNVRTGKIRVFSSAKGEITTDAILASATLPTLSRAIEIMNPDTQEYDAFWDGGYMGNPPLFPLYYQTESRDILIIHINPIERPEIPRTARDIENRVNEISFNASLLAELRSIRFVKRLIGEGRVKANEMRDLNIHSVVDDETMRALSVATKLSPTPVLIQSLRTKGADAMDAFLRECGDRLGKETTCDLMGMLE